MICGIFKIFIFFYFHFSGEIVSVNETEEEKGSQIEKYSCKLDE